jgi:predicted O-methyltransferase YrrM
MGFFSNALIQQYLFRKPYGIHSPFLYGFAKDCIFKDDFDPAFEHLEKIRKALKKDARNIQVTDFGQGRRFGPRRGRPGDPPLHYSRQVRSIARNSLQQPRVCRLFFRIARYFKANTMVELGTSLGLTTSYLALARPTARVITLEGCPQTAAIAQETFGKAGANNVELIPGDFAQTLPALLETSIKPDLVYIDGDHSLEGVLRNFSHISKHLHESSVVIIDDIRWSGGMRAAWKHLVAYEKTSMALDLGSIGILFFDPALSKQRVRVGF